MAFPGLNYAPPGVYTTTEYENPFSGGAGGLKMPVFIGEGTETLGSVNVEMVRGSSASIDQQRVKENMAGRAVVDVAFDGHVTLGDFDGQITQIQVKHFPIVNGKGQGKTTNSRGDVEVTINGDQVVVLSVEGESGIIELAQAPEFGDTVRVTYFFNRTDTLTTDNVSAQVSDAPSTIFGSKGLAQNEHVLLHDDVLGPNGEVSIPGNNTLSLIVDGQLVNVTVGAGSYDMQQLADMVNTLIPALNCYVEVNNYGKDILALSAQQQIEVRRGGINAAIGLRVGQTDVRNRTFYVFQGPIVDGSNGGITTTNPGDVKVTVDGDVVVPSSVNGTMRSVTLAVAPPVGAEVFIEYHFNAWQETFDYLPAVDVVSVEALGDIPDSRSYTEGADFVLQSDRILWGTAWVGEASNTSIGAEPFGDSQISGLLIDDRSFLTPAEPFTIVSGGLVRTSATEFVLPLQPTLGNGRDTPLGSSLFQTTSNGRIDLPTNRPDVIWAYHGIDEQDALMRGRVPVIAVDGAKITLGSSVPQGHKVYATFWHNRTTDLELSVVSVLEGPSGVGQYKITDKQGKSLFSSTLGAKSGHLNGIQIEFPSGSELKPGFHFEGGGRGYKGPVEETVTVEFATKDATSAKYVMPGNAPYYFVDGESSTLSFKASGDTDTINLGAAGKSFHASYVGGVVEYDQFDQGKLLGWSVSAPEEVKLLVDGVSITAAYQAPLDPMDLLSVKDVCEIINHAASGVAGVVDADGDTITLNVDSTLFNNTPNFYDGWKVVVGAGATQIVAGSVGTISSYDSVLGRFTLDGAIDAGHEFKQMDKFRLYNPATLAKVRSTTKFNKPVEIIAGKFDKLAIDYEGSTNNESITITLDDDTYATATDLAAELQSKLSGAVATDGLEIYCKAVDGGYLEFSFQVPGDDTYGTLTFKATAPAAEDFAVLAGLGEGLGLLQGPIASAYRQDSGNGYFNDRISLQNRILPSNRVDLAQCGLQITAASGNARVGLQTGRKAEAGVTGSIMPPAVYGVLGLNGGQDVVTGEPVFTFYDGSGAEPANNIFEINFDGASYTVTFLAGPTEISSIVTQMGTALSAVATVEQIGAGILITSKKTEGVIEVRTSLLGFTAGDIQSSVPVSAERLVSAVNNVLLDGANTDAVAFVHRDSAGKTYFALQHQPVAPGDFGHPSNIQLLPSSWLLHGTGVRARVGDGAVGQPEVNGFFVTSSNPAKGSGSANTSKLNPGQGQDGIVGQTYRDTVTGLTFTILPQGFNANPDGPWAGNYPDTATFDIHVSKTFTCSSNIPHNAIPGLELTVSDTELVPQGDSARINVYNKGGAEPAVGDIYYVSYTYTKENFDVKFFDNISAVIDEYGEISAQNPVSLACHLAFINGAGGVGVKQVRREPGRPMASVAAYRDAIDELEGVVPGGINPDIIVPLRGDSPDLFLYLKRHNDIQSSIRYKAERTSIVGLSSGSDLAKAKSIAADLDSDRMRLVYPDTAIVQLPDGSEDIVDGPMIAAAFVGSVVRPTLDVATPWTNRRIVGFTRLGRRLNAVQMNQAAVSGITVFEERLGSIQVRHGLTTYQDQTNQLMRIPTVRLIADEVQQQARALLDDFIGTKFLPGVLGQIEGRMTNLFKGLVQQGIVGRFTGIKATVSADDPTVAEVEAYYTPVFPLLYISITFKLRSRL